MAAQLPFETEIPETRRAKRERLRRGVTALPRNSGVTSFLAEMAASLLDVQSQMEDTLLTTNQIVPDAATAETKAATMRDFRTLVPQVQELFGRVYMAARTDCASVVEAMGVDEDIPGLTPAQAKAIRDLHTKKQTQRNRETSDGNRILQ